MDWNVTVIFSDHNGKFLNISMNLKGIMLNEENQSNNLHTTWVHLFDILEKIKQQG